MFLGIQDGDRRGTTRFIYFSLSELSVYFLFLDHENIF